MSYKSFGLTLIGGMTAASVLTLLVIPVFYTFFDDLRIAVARTLKGVLTRRGHPRANLSTSEEGSGG
jgi:HAE1 family hydrophobic/amphiphilic exporter-1